MRKIEMLIMQLADKAAKAEPEQAIKFAECAQRLADVHHTMMELEFQKQHIEGPGFGFEMEKPIEPKKN